MIRTNTVLILGAGSSYEVGFPLGRKLIEEIYSLVMGQTNGFHKNSLGNIDQVNLPNVKLLWRLLDVKGEKKEDGSAYSVDYIQQFAKDLWDSQLSSIDDFLSYRKEYSLIGKLCILFVLSMYEDAKRFSPNFNIPSGTYAPGHEPVGEWNYPKWGWYKYLWERLQEGTGGDFENLKQNNLSIITFNYDRSLEHFLFTAMKSAYGSQVQEPDCADFFINIPVKHVYGELGVLPWKLNLDEYQERYQKEPDAVNDFTPWELDVLFRLWGGVDEYGATSHDFEPHLAIIQESGRQKMAATFIDRAKEIKTYHEVSSGSEYKNILREAKCIYFLGFGYHEQNIRALWLDKGILSSDVQICGTAVNMTNVEVQQIKNCVASFSVPQEKLNIVNKWEGIDSLGSSKVTGFLRNIAPFE